EKHTHSPTLRTASVQALGSSGEAGSTTPAMPYTTCAGAISRGATARIVPCVDAAAAATPPMTTPRTRTPRTPGPSAPSPATLTPRGTPVPPFVMDRPVLHAIVRELVDTERLAEFSEALPTRARISESALPPVLATLHERLERPLVVLLPEDADARDAAEAAG